VAETVEVVVTTPDGQAATLSGGYTYAPPQFSDFNGVWEGHLGDEGETPFAFTVENDLLASISCNSNTSSSPPSTKTDR
jgi:hypothetical protein